jgi:hypothetical protein
MFEESKNNIWVGTRFKGIAQLKNRSNDTSNKHHISLSDFVKR